MRAIGRTLRPYVLFTVLSVALAVPAVAEPGHSDVLSAVRIANFGSVGDTYYRGAQPKGHDFVDLASLGVKTVIDLQEYGDRDEPALAKQAGLRYVRIPMTT